MPRSDPAVGADSELGVSRRMIEALTQKQVAD